MHLEHFRSALERQAAQLVQQASADMEQITRKYDFGEAGARGGLRSELMPSLHRILRGNQTREWVESMSRYVNLVIDKSQESLSQLLEDLRVALQVGNWEERQEEEHNQVYKRFLEHLHPHPMPDPQFFRFDPQMCHCGIRLYEGSIEAVYHRSLPSKPAVVLSHPFDPLRRRVAFRVLKLECRAWLFPKTTVCLGACLPEFVQLVGFRRVTDPGRGGFMIGSTGWSYHHSDPLFSKKERVGWGFAEGDRLELELLPEPPGHLLFTKRGRLCDSRFQMPLGLSQQQIWTLRPCLSFDAEEGAIVKVVNC